MTTPYNQELIDARSARLRQFIQVTDFENDLRSRHGEAAPIRCGFCHGSHGRQALLDQLRSWLKVLFILLVFTFSAQSTTGRVSANGLTLVDGLDNSVNDSTQAHDFEQFVLTAIDLPFFRDTLVCVRNKVRPSPSCSNTFAYSRFSSVAAALRRVHLPLRERVIAGTVFLRWGTTLRIRLGESMCPLWPGLMKEEAECLGLLMLLRFGTQVDLVTTNSSLTNQTLMWHLSPPAGTRHMLHYSENSRNSLPDPLHDRYTKLLGRSTIDSHWVWTEDFARYLRVATGRRATPVGPILLYPLSHEAEDEGPLSVIFCEVYPVDPIKFIGGVDHRVPLYSTESQIETLTLIQEGIRLAEAELEKSILLQIRPKRDFAPDIHSQEYLVFRNGILNSRIVLADPRIRQDLAVQSASVTLAYPWSSAISLAHFLNRDAAAVATRKLNRVRAAQPSGSELLTSSHEVGRWLSENFRRRLRKQNLT